MNGIYQNKVLQLPTLSDTKYENIFKLFKTENNQYFYNIINTVYFPKLINETMIDYITVRQRLPWTMISYNAYKTIDLWWLICLVNNIYNPIIIPNIGTTLKILKPTFVRQVIDELQTYLT
jgi:hypothetical protein